MKKPMARHPLRLAMSPDSEVSDRVGSAGLQEDWYQAIDPSLPIVENTIYLNPRTVPDYIRADHEGILKVTVPKINHVNP